MGTATGAGTRVFAAFAADQWAKARELIIATPVRVRPALANFFLLYLARYIGAHTLRPMSASGVPEDTACFVPNLFAIALSEC